MALNPSLRPSRTATKRLVGVAVVSVLVAGAAYSASATPSPTRHSASATRSSSQAVRVPARTLFQQACSSCHVLAAADAHFGSFGPNLDRAKPTVSLLSSQMTKGGGIMPAFGTDHILTHAQIIELARYVAAVAGT